MVTCTVNGVEVSVEPGTNVLEAAKQAGFEVPYFCYHPGLSSPANCRMCVIDLGGGRLGPSCYTPVSEGGEYRTDSDQVTSFQQANLEFILVNHPVDCPICDQSGECDLQDLYYKFSRRRSRLSVEKVHKPKAVPIGPEVVLDAERCILCTKCIRVCDEVAQETQLCLTNRGDRSEIAVFPGMELDHAYSLCTVDVCPVGALTSRDFRFRARVWYLRSVPSVCPGCATGCNVEVDHTDGTIRRLRPRHNPDVNQYWMCDEGRYTYQAVQENRIMQPRLKLNGSQDGASWTDALSRAADRLNMALASEGEKRAGVAVVVSPECSNEDIYALARFVSECLQGSSIYVGGPATGEGDDILRDTDKSPNRKGLEVILQAFGLKTQDTRALAADLAAGGVGAVYTLGNVFAGEQSELAPTLDAAIATGCLISQSTNEAPDTGSAQVVLPASSWAEIDGSFTNRQGRVQRLKAAVPAKGMSKPHWKIITLLAQRMGHDFEFESGRDVLRDLAARVPAFSGVAPDTLGLLGIPLRSAAEAAAPSPESSPPPAGGEA